MTIKRKGKQILAIIPARGGSKGVPAKNKRIIRGKPLISWTIESALSSKYISKVIVSSDDQEIIDIAIELGAEAPFVRPKRISDDYSSTESALLHCLDYLEKNQNYIPDSIVLLQPTSPFRKEGSIDGALHLFLERDCDSLVSVSPLEGFLWKDTIPPTANYDYNNRPRRQDIDHKNRDLMENGSIYITKTSSFLIHKNRLCGDMVLYEMSPEEGFEIDTQLDWNILEAILGEDQYAKDK